tara:strand:+ start:549 stop:1157 length:609 start_codon:yes stop_codon:yes gene_type:complete
VLNLLVDDLIGARASNIHKIWIVELSLVLLVVSKLHYLLLQRVYLLLLMELALLLSSALAQVVAHQLIAQILHWIWCLGQIGHEATDGYICRRILLQIHNLVGLQYWAYVGARDCLLSKPNSYILQYLLLHQLILCLKLLNLLLQLLAKVHVCSSTCDPGPLTHLRRRTRLGDIAWLSHHIAALRRLDATLRDRLTGMWTLS